MINVNWNRQGYQAIEAARTLRSEDGENPEYDRALVDLIVALYSGSTENDAQDVEDAIMGDK